jgi:DNA-binding Lrp family transcriptional regulator
MITAFILITAEPGSVPALAERLLDVPGITEVYSVAGPYDLIAIARVKQHEDLAALVTAHAANLPGVMRTDTSIAFRAFSRRDLESIWEIGDA